MRTALKLLNRYSGLSYQPIYNFTIKTVNLPFLADSINEGMVATLAKKQGQWVQQDETVSSVETDKVTIQIKAPIAGILAKYHVSEGDNLDVGKPFFDIDPEGKKSASTPSTTTATMESKKMQSKTIESTKVQQNQENKIKEQNKKQTGISDGKGNEGVKKDEINIKNQRVQKRQTMSRLRLRVAQRLKQSQNNYALLTTFQEVDMLQAQKARKDLGDDFLKKYGIKLGFMSFFIKASTLALMQYPVANSAIDGKDIISRNYVDISVAVATPMGLLVPVLRNCQNMKFHQMERGMAQLAKKGKQGKITIQEMQGGTFTISNGGTFGSLMGTPILNPPQSAILGMHSIINKPVVRGDQIVARPMMYLALTYDHRLLDGKDAVLFLKSIKSNIQDPRRMLLQI